jgi:hypothetical protein
MNQTLTRTGFHASRFPILKYPNAIILIFPNFIKIAWCAAQQTLILLLSATLTIYYKINPLKKQAQTAKDD